jgi:hypothetical protein
MQKISQIEDELRRIDAVIEGDDPPDRFLLHFVLLSSEVLFASH